MSSVEHKPIQLFVKRMFPDFVSEEYPQLVLFMQKILEYMDREGGEYSSVSHLLEYNDVDSTIAHFESTFKTQYLQNFPDTLAADVDLMVKNIRSFYLSKGTEESYRFLFNALYNVAVNFKYPKFNILRVSDGLWYTPTFLVLTDTGNNIPPELSGLPYDVSKLLENFITGAESGAVAYIDAVKILGDETPPLTYGGDPAVLAVEIVEKEGDFIAGEQILVGDTIIENGGFSGSTNNWSLSPVKDTGIYTLNNQLVLKQTGAFTGTRRIYQGVEVEENVRYWLRFRMVGADAAQTRVTVEYTSTPTATPFYNSGNLGTGAVDVLILLPPIGPGKSMIYVSVFNEMTVLDQKATYDSISLVKQDLSGAPLLFIANIAAESGIKLGTSQYKDVRGFLSEGKGNNKGTEIVLQDGTYYQDFSYVLTTSVADDAYKSIFKDLVHPAGFVMFTNLTEPDILSYFSLRECTYTDLVFANSGGSDTITRTSSGQTFDSLFRQGDVVKCEKFKASGENDMLNVGEYLVVSVTPTVLTFGSTTSLQDDNTNGMRVQLSTGMGIMLLAQADAWESVYEPLFGPMMVLTDPELYDTMEIDYFAVFGFGQTWAEAELNREALGITIEEWGNLVIGDFDTYATSRFGFIQATERTWVAE